MEEKETVQTAEDLYITFTIGRPRDENESEFDSIVFRLLKLNDIMKKRNEERISIFDIENNNKNIEEMQKLLENFKFKSFKEESNERENS